MATSKIPGLRTFYSIDDAAALEYFTVHEAADVQHSAVKRELLESLLHAGNVENVTATTAKVLSALNGVLSAV